MTTGEVERLDPGALLERVSKLTAAAPRKPDSELEESKPKDDDRAPTIDELREKARREINRQLSHKDGKMRRDAARMAIEMADGRWQQDEEEQVTKVVFETVAIQPPSDPSADRDPFETAVSTPPPPPEL